MGWRPVFEKKRDWQWQKSWYLTKVIQTRYKDFIPVENLFQIGKNGGAGQEPDQRAGGRALRQADQVPTGRCAHSHS